ncbi:MAG: redox-sensing transcriptional repressor Rex [Ruminococcus sp.]|nr:redox-sensing transcriptional repressor Rex [Ruminococcus sp.]
MPKNDRISVSVIKRLPRYYRFLGELSQQGIERISSRELSDRMKLTASQIRQDLNCFGGFGQQGYGYNVAELRGEIGRILGVDRQFGTIIIGAGNLGRAIAMHINFDTRGCRLTGVFDIDPALEGRKVGELTVLPMTALEEFCRRECPLAAVLCIPKSETQQVADQLTRLGIKAIWNFSHYDLSGYEGMIVENVHLGDSLLTLTYGLNSLIPRSEPHEIERKYLIFRPTEDELAAIEGIKRTDIVQTYLSAPENGPMRRVRKRGTEADGWTYTYTEKTHVSFGDRIEIEREIDVDEYDRLIKESLPDRPPIIKSRYVFTYKDQVFELDIYDFSDEYATLEIELESIDDEVFLPPYIKLIRDVTGDRLYSNSELARTRLLIP